MAWIIDSVDTQIVLNLRLYKSARFVWEYLQKIYSQSDNARWFQLEFELTIFS